MKDTYTEALAAHLDANRHPMPSPTMSEHGQRLTRAPIRIEPDESIDAMRERLEQRQREIDEIIGPDGDIDNIPGLQRARPVAGCGVADDAWADDVGGIMTPNQLPPLPEPDTHCFDDDTGKDVWSYTADQMHAYALAAIAQQAQEPVAWLVSLPDEPELGEWFSEQDMSEQGYTSKPLYTTPPAPQVPAPVDEQAEFEAWDGQIRKTVEAVQDPDTVPAFHNGYYTLTPDELRRAIIAMRPTVEPMTPEQREVLAALVVGACEHKTRTLLALRAIEATEAQYGIGITAKAEGVRDGRST